jgi:hypothetical protein
MKLVAALRIELNLRTYETRQTTRPSQQRILNKYIICKNVKIAIKLLNLNINNFFVLDIAHAALTISTGNMIAN